MRSWFKQIKCLQEICSYYLQLSLSQFIYIVLWKHKFIKKIGVTGVFRKKLSNSGTQTNLFNLYYVNGSGVTPSSNCPEFITILHL